MSQANVINRNQYRDIFLIQMISFSFLIITISQKTVGVILKQEIVF